MTPVIRQKNTEKGNTGSLSTLCILLLFVAVSVICRISCSLAFVPDGRNSTSNLVVKFRDNLLYIKASTVPLDEVLKEISEETNIKIVTLGTLEEPVTFKSRKIPLDQALMKLIEGKADYLFIYEKPSVLKKAWIYSKIREDEYMESERDRHRPAQERNIGDPNASLEDIEGIENPEILLSMPLEDYFSNAKSPKEQMHVIDMLGELGDPRASEVLISAMDVGDEDVRESVCHALGEIGGSRAIEGLVKALKDDDPWVRAAAAECLAGLNARSALPYLLEASDKEQNKETTESIQEALDLLTHQK